MLLKLGIRENSEGIKISSAKHDYAQARSLASAIGRLFREPPALQKFCIILQK